MDLKGYLDQPQLMQELQSQRSFIDENAADVKISIFPQPCSTVRDCASQSN